MSMMKKLSVLILLILSQVTSAITLIRFDIPTQQAAVMPLNVKASSQTLPNEFKLLVWNIYKGGKKKFKREWNKFKDADLILLQEYVDKEIIRDLITDTETDATMGISFYTKSNNQKPTGVVTTSQSIEQFSQVLHSPDGEPITNTPKASVLTSYSLENGETLLVVNTHGINFTRVRAFNRQIQNIYDEVKNHRGPLIWAGDFNTWNQSRLDFLRATTNKLKMDAVEFSPDLRKTFLGNPLDHIFVRGLNFSLGYTVPCPGSDHNPLFLNLSIKGP